ncbi:hypothetical protein [Lactococcus garvieae]|uniref:Uncharacterized protein n=2 Tax=Lactococcus garvieae TaxID=1363 RepID=A0AA46TV28_9LACT|nr:hypothetical protein [Lactococcus garvieae]UYT09933.1 hypothetical protein OF801_08120 [Lactococcus garvieae]UYT11905.1 hypothetical protein OF800_07770 [Lactococcus garvieae]
MNKRVLGIGGISCLIISVIFTILSTNALQVDGTSLDFSNPTDVSAGATTLDRRDFTSNMY